MFHLNLKFKFLLLKKAFLKFEFFFIFHTHSFEMCFDEIYFFFKLHKSAFRPWIIVWD